MNKSLRRYFALLLLSLVPMLSCGSGRDGGTQNLPSASPAKVITAYSFVDPAATGVINEGAKTISISVPYGTNVTALAATFTTTGTSVKVGTTLQVSGATQNDFTDPVLYAVTAADSSMAVYTVTVTVAQSSQKSITAFSFSNPVTTGVIDEVAKTISLTVPSGTNLTALVASFTTTGTSVKVGTTPSVSI